MGAYATYKLAKWLTVCAFGRAGVGEAVNGRGQLLSDLPYIPHLDTPATNIGCTQSLQMLHMFITKVFQA